MAGSALETDGAGAVFREYITLGGATIAIVDAAGIAYVHDDHLATPQVMTDGAAAVVWDASYRPFGEAGIAGAAANAQRFPGQTADAETGWYDNWHRTYDPALGRYLQSDPIGIAAGFNTYGYAGGNPVMYADPTGQIIPALLLVVRVVDLGFKAYFIGLELYAIYETYQAVMARYQAGCELRDLVGFWDVVTLVPALRYVRMAGRLAGAGKGAGRFLGRFLADETGSVRLPGGAGGRQAKQQRLRELAEDSRVSSADRGWIRQEINAIERGNRNTIRNPPGRDLAHERGREAAKGYDYTYSNLQDRGLHKLQHKYDNYGRANKERPPRFE